MINILEIAVVIAIAINIILWLYVIVDVILRLFKWPDSEMASYLFGGPVIYYKDFKGENNARSYTQRKEEEQSQGLKLRCEKKNKEN